MSTACLPESDASAPKNPFKFKMLRTALVALGLVLLPAARAFADNPIVQTSYTADPAPVVYDGRLYVYTSHDEDVTVNNFFTMNDWRLYSTADMVNWTDHGSPAGYKSYSWGTGDAWAVQGISRNGKYYLYTPINNSTGSKIGVLVGNNPWGPFTDPLGKALISTGSGNIDPTVFIDSDGQAYLYWGNPQLYYVKLNSDMISFPGSPNAVSLTTAGFGVRSNTDRATAYEEGPWFYKRGSLYYIVYPADGTPEKISYTTSSGSTGPWMYRGDIMAKESGSGSSFTNHPGVIDYQGHSYFFYHNGALPGGGGYKRSVCVEEFTYKSDGTIPTITMSTAGPAAIATLNPFQQVEAETIAFSAGLKTEVCSEGGMDVTQISNGDYIKVKNVAFGAGATSFDARVASSTSGGNIELHLDSLSGTVIGTCAIAGTGGAQTWTTKSCSVTSTTGTHDLFLKFTGSGTGVLFNFNWWKFGGPGATSTDGGGTGGTGTGGGSGTGGMAGSGGKGGTAGTGATGTGGTVGSGGSTGTGGTGTGGRGGSSGGTGGTIVTGTGGAAGSGATGSGGIKGTGGVTGSGGLASTGGSTGSGGAVGSGGVTGTGGSATTGSTGGSGEGGAASGCSCQSSPGRGDGVFGILTLLGATIFLRRRENRPTARSRAGSR
jgi:arabinoxylan arabinofuranohydrolase